MKTLLLILASMLAVQVSLFANVKLTAEQLIQSADVIAVVNVPLVARARVHDAGLDLSVFPQSARAQVELCVHGNVSGEITISNQRDSVLAPGKYLAFLVRSGDRFQLSSATSFRRVKAALVYWFPEYVPLNKVIAEIESLKRQPRP